MELRTNKRIEWLAALVTVVLVGGWIVTVPTRLEFQPQTKISVKGTSTVHDFQCEAAAVTGTVVLSAPQTDDVRQMLGGLQAVNVTVPVAKIDCGNGTMDKKMRAALDVNNAPLIKYTLDEALVVGTADDEGYYTLNAKGRLSMAGEERPIDMNVRGQQRADGLFAFSGSRTIRMSDWNIDAPSAMFGAVKTGDEVTVEFEVLAASF